MPFKYKTKGGYCFLLVFTGELLLLTQCSAFFGSLLPPNQAINRRALSRRKTAIVFGLETADYNIFEGGEISDSMANDDLSSSLQLPGETGETSLSAADDGTTENSTNVPPALDTEITTSNLMNSPFSVSENPEAKQPPPPPYFATNAKEALTETDTTMDMSRRAWLQTGALIFGSTVIGAGAILHEQSTLPNKPQQSIPPPAAKLEPVNFTKVAAETSVNVTLKCPEACLSVNSETFTKVKSPKVPNWMPSWMAPRPKIVKEISNAELLVAAIIAGSSIDLLRTSLLYPIQTIKTRIQTDIHKYENEPPPIIRRITDLGTNVQKHVDEGNLYAGIKPTLLVSVPATGVYYGVRDVSKRMLQMTALNNVEIALCGALIADVISLCFRNPADTLALRLQNMDDDVGDWFADSVKRLPSIIISDIPYLLSKISLNRLLIHGNISIDRYTEFAILTATLAAIFTTPFDVARTRILIDSDGDFSNGKDGGSGEGVLETMRRVAKEGDGGIVNLFAGWFERALYLGLGRAW
jgi:hypothetical protein